MSELLGIDFVLSGLTPSDASFKERSVSEIKTLPPMVSIQSKLLKSDYHGAILTGVPKRHTVFQIELEIKGTASQIQKLVLEIFGNQFAFRAADRVGKKFKTKAFVEL
ncbi:uncharacterized protein MELLADRAFT_106821 [Melampsora larici-populina 98AG31]|uniref:Uncharacterized protein n=1 Tax=Melampsora larici-populina (strain 98AG31 / pathotype 3-4-7) TaxID=747676 RepID=F4RMR5_MELLP|nr:uncharacterized protein MELLADRAFT_106821 [Melampsora larici-populina 98AG31]EGG06333.1 hypothetical protein MELLADRAFT_106821 [Melampsora larici-populina 98AG31]